MNNAFVTKALAAYVAEQKAAEAAAAAEEQRERERRQTYVSSATNLLHNITRDAWGLDVASLMSWRVEPNYTLTEEVTFSTRSGAFEFSAAIEYFPEGEGYKATWRIHHTCPRCTRVQRWTIGTYGNRYYGSTCPALAVVGGTIEIVDVEIVRHAQQCQHQP